MAEEAIRVLADGREELVQAVDIDKELPGSYYICNGIGDGEIPCRVPVTFVARKSGPYFSVKGGRQHVAGCDCDKRREARVISRLNQLGKNLTQEALYAQLTAQNRRAGGGGGGGNGGGNGGANGGAENEIDVRPVVAALRNPDSLRIIVRLLMGKDRTDTFCGIPVSDWLMDGCGVAYARKNGIPKGSFKIVFAEKTTRWREFSLPIVEDDSNQESMVFVDAYSYEQGADPIFYLVEMPRELAEKILKMDPAKYVVAIFSRWHPYGTERDVYISDRESDSHIVILRRSDLSDLYK